MNPEEPVQKLIRLKRYEQPRPGYFEDFLQDFHRRQRRELLQRSSISLFFERLATWLREVGTVKWVVGATTAYAALMITIFLWPGQPGNTPDPNISPVLHE